MTWYKFSTPWGAEIEAFVRDNTQDWNTLQSCLTEDEYLLNNIPNCDDEKPWCVDVGAHIGGFTLAALSKGYKVVVVEPLPENLDSLIKNVERNNWADRVIIHNKAIHKVSGEVLNITYGDTSTEFGKHHEFIGNTNYSDVFDPSLRSVEVETVSIDDAIQDIDHVKVFKIDCEGAEWSALKGFNSAYKIDSFVAEVHNPAPQKNLRKAFGSLIGKLYKDKTVEYFGNQAGPEVIGLVYFTK
jgi:FkbM family methyltransferase